ncbi:MAG: mandelate racemase/muconate lactonizing enzyme family protein, partial [Dehalococcoidia bacterium]
MKITDLRVCLTRPGNSNRSWVFVEIDTDEGITGVGESTNSGGGGALVVGRAYEMLKNDLEGQDFSEGLVGLDPRDIDAIWHRIYRRFGTLGSRGFGTTLASGIDMALWDIKGKALGRPVWDLLGGKMRDEVPIYSHIAPADDIDACVADAKEQVALGYQALKLDPFSPEMGKHHRRY